MFALRSRNLNKFYAGYAQPVSHTDIYERPVYQEAGRNLWNETPELFPSSFLAEVVKESIEENLSDWGLNADLEIIEVL